jgi:hypothetical protein
MELRTPSKIRESAMYDNKNDDTEDFLAVTGCLGNVLAILIVAGVVVGAAFLFSFLLLLSTGN